MKSVIASLIELINDDDNNDSQIKSQHDELIHLFMDASELQESLLALIPLDEKDKQNT